MSSDRTTLPRITRTGQSGADIEHQLRTLLPMTRAIVAMHVRTDPARFAVAGEMDPVYEEAIRGTFAAETGRQVRVWMAELPTPEGGWLAAGYAMAELCEQDLLTLSPRCIYIHDVYIDPAHRSRGIGRALIAACREWAAQERISTLRLITMSGNGAARESFTRHGFRPSTVELVMPV
jgi:GNAT superfamily N-acetyltransferase